MKVSIHRQYVLLQVDQAKVLSIWIHRMLWRNEFSDVGLLTPAYKRIPKRHVVAHPIMERASQASQSCSGRFSKTLIRTFYTIVICPLSRSRHPRTLTDREIKSQLLQLTITVRCFETTRLFSGC